tara:strand:+ start:8474 stop:8887 length:414 start_codon:yes stop_codon:yes gene_type:complete
MIVERENVQRYLNSGTLLVSKKSPGEFSMQIRILLMALVALCASSLAMASDYYVDITNRTGYTIYYMYVSPGKSKSWEEDVLGSDVLMNGDTQRVTLTGYTNPYFDIRLVDEDNDSYTFWNIDVSKQDIVVTLDHLD